MGKFKIWKGTSSNISTKKYWKGVGEGATGCVRIVASRVNERLVHLKKVTVVGKGIEKLKCEWYSVFSSVLRGLVGGKIIKQW